VAQVLPVGLIERGLDYLQNTQRGDGGWSDEHDMAHWQPAVTMSVLVTLERYGRL
jgi:hypothetical protein